jgi:DNA-directed RNA polymerase specialized sigma24 family protein
MTAPEIASALGLKVNTVYSRLRIARSALAARLGALATEAAS